MSRKFILFLLVLWFIPIALVYFHTTDAFDQDLGRHLKLGEIIWQTKSVPKTNLFSYTNPDEPVFNSHWGSQVIFYGIHKAFGVNGLILFNTIINTAAFSMLFLLTGLRIGFFIPSVLFIPFVYMLLDRTWIRPEMFGNLFYAVLLVSLFSKRARKYIKWFFPVIAFLWINLHISAVFGVFSMFVVLLQDSISEYSENSVSQNLRRVRKSEKSDSLIHRFSDMPMFRVFRVFRINFLILILTITSLLINPYGLSGVLSAFTVLTKYGYAIVENQSFWFLKDFGFPLASHIFFGFFLVFFSYLVTIRRLRKPLLGELILLVVISLLTLRFVRNETLFAYSAFLTAVFNVTQLLSFLPKALMKTNITIGVNILLIIISLFLINYSHNARGLPVGFANKESYKEVVDFFLAENISGPMFNNFDIGGYLIYRLYPQHSVFIDNRPEAYPVAFFQDIYIPMQIDPLKFEKFAKQYSIKTILWGRRDITPWSQEFLKSIAKNNNWKMVYVDDAAVVYTRNK